MLNFLELIKNFQIFLRIYFQKLFRIFQILFKFSQIFLKIQSKLLRKFY